MGEFRQKQKSVLSSCPVPPLHATPPPSTPQLSQVPKRTSSQRDEQTRLQVALPPPSPLSLSSPLTPKSSTVRMIRCGERLAQAFVPARFSHLRLARLYPGRFPSAASFADLFPDPRNTAALFIRLQPACNKLTRIHSLAVDDPPGKATLENQHCAGSRPHHAPIRPAPPSPTPRAPGAFSPSSAPSRSRSTTPSPARIESRSSLPPTSPSFPAKFSPCSAPPAPANRPCSAC